MPEYKEHTLKKISQEQLSRAARPIIERVKNHDLVTYKAFGKLTGIESPDSTAAVLHPIAAATHKSGCGLANVIVRRDDGNVGYGFFLIAAFLGYGVSRTTKDPSRCCVSDGRGIF
jgi:hypothetical protein